MDIDNTFEGDACELCESTTFYIDDGVKVCVNGHEQGEGQIVGEDEDDFGHQGRVVRKKVEKTKGKFSKVYRGPKAFRLFVQAYQFILWKQCYALIHDKGLPPQLWTIVRDLWTLRLSKLLHRLESDQPVDSESQAFSSAEEGGEDGGRKSVKTVGKSIDSPKLVETIALCYMGILLLRLPIGLVDIYRWIKEEDVLYVRAIRGVPIDMQEKLPGEYHKVLDTTVMLRPEELHRAVSDLATMYHQTFGLALPRLNHEVLLHKYIMQLALPLEIFPAVQWLAQATQSKFSYSISNETRRKQGSAFPELQLMSLLVIGVKLLYPFDDVKHHPQSIREPTAQKIDWENWKQCQQDSAKRSPGAGLARGNEIDVCDKDVFKMSQQELDSYMEWYQKTWAREPCPGSDDRVNKEILDMFPLPSLDPVVHPPASLREKEVEEIAIQKTRATIASMRFQRPVTDEEASNDSVDVRRPGEDYRSYKTEQDLPEAAMAFFIAASETACTSVKNLLLAVRQAEAKITKWKRAKRRAEVTGEEFDLDAEMRIDPEGRPETRMQQEMEAMRIQDSAVDSGGGVGKGGEEEEVDSDIDMEMMS